MHACAGHDRRAGRRTATTIQHPRRRLMFATIVGPYPRSAGLDDEAALCLALTDQLEAHMGILADGAATPDADVLSAWRRTDAMARELVVGLGLEPRPVKARLTGPWTTATRAGPGRRDRRRATMAAARVANEQLRAVFAAGASMAQVEDDALATIAADDRPAHAQAIDGLMALMDGVVGHVTLSISGADPSGAGPAVLYAAPFSSHVFDVCLGPDGWRMARQAPSERGLILGVADCRRPAPDYLPILVWAARYGASMGSRGLERIGLAPSAGIERLSVEAAQGKLQRLAKAAEVAGLPMEAMRDALPKEALPRGTLPGRTLVPRRGRRDPGQGR
jgi:hypothetical protein